MNCRAGREKLCMNKKGEVKQCFWVGHVEKQAPYMSCLEGARQARREMDMNWARPGLRPCYPTGQTPSCLHLLGPS